MPNLARTIREEITRLARKEIRSQTPGLKKAVVRYRGNIAELKRQFAKLSAEIVQLRRLAARGATPEAQEPPSRGLRFSAKSVAAQRRRLGMSAAAFGKLLGVSGQTVYKWEHGAARPRSKQLIALAAARGMGKREAAARAAGKAK